jgi:chromosome partitioning protein
MKGLAMRTFALVSQKGGSGKTTLCTQLAVYAAECGEGVAILDLDSQGSALAWSRVRGTKVPAVLPANPEQIPDLVKNSPMFGVSLLLIDTMPHSDAGALAAIRAADLIISPTQPSFFDIAALRDTTKLLDLCGRMDVAAGVVNNLPSGKGAKAAFEEAAVAIQGLGLRVCEAPVCNRRPFVNAIGRGAGVTEIYRADKAAQEIMALWDELNRLCPIVTPAKEKVS